MSFLSALRCGISDAWLAVVRYANWLAGALCAGGALLNSTHPEVVTQVENALPTWAKFFAMFAWCSFMAYALNRAKSDVR